MAGGIRDFFTAGSIATYAGATLAVYVLSNTIRILFKKNSVWISFTIAMLISFIGAYAAKILKLELVSIFLCILNGCLLFLSAVGAQETIANAGAKVFAHRKPEDSERISWTSSWFSAS